MNHVSNIAPSFTCPICLDGITTGQFGERTLVRTACQPKSHVFHLECITTWFDGEQQLNKRLDERECGHCKQPALPLASLNENQSLENESPYCESLVLQACRTGDLKTLGRLLADDASLAIRTCRSALTGQPVYPLTIAIESGQIDCARVLIDHKADVNAADQQGQTPLHIAVENGHVHCLNQLVSHGANVNATNNLGETPLHMTVKISRIQAYQRFVLDRHFEESSNEARIFTRFTCKKENDTGCLKALLANSEVNINAIDDEGITPLMIAVLWGESGHLQCLLEAGANIIVTDQLDWDALHLLACNDSAQCLKIFLATPGIQVNMKNELGWTALHVAAKFASTESLKVLLATPGIRVNEKVDGMTALHIAALFDNPECIAVLLATAGIEIHERNNEGKTALCLAVIHNHSECIKLLIANGAKWTSSGRLSGNSARLGVPVARTAEN
ncbi:ankyrin repeat domain-containing protein [Endozoicomonas sp. ONNA2]|uniref:ankyrin repeat domain-containing protein n=1 Tax=Endozoicomonas sp. ONNA2 TaxID=2828741 RepID=UPI00214832F1|nr:ankyrin repeat domain-containing protein [Endozoicomonas sp. ONNA2]